MITAEESLSHYPSLISSSNIPASLITPCALRSSFIAGSACPECPRGAAEWPVPPLTLRAAVTLHHLTLHLGWCGHLATGARVRLSRTRGYWEINRYASAQPSKLSAWLAGWLLPPPSLPYTSPSSLVMAKWRRCSSHFSTPRCTWISCYRIRNAAACQGLAALDADVSVLSTGLHFHPMFGLRGGETAINQISEEDFVSITASAMKKCWPKITLVHNRSPPQEFLSALRSISESNNCTSPILPWLILWILSTWVYVNLIRNLSDMDTKITFISRTMINVKGITESPKIKTEDF